MIDLEKHDFSMNETMGLDNLSMRDNDNTHEHLMETKNYKNGYLSDQGIEDHSFMNHTTRKAPSPTSKHMKEDEKELSMDSDSVNTENIRSSNSDDLDKGKCLKGLLNINFNKIKSCFKFIILELSSEDKGVTKTPESKERS